MDFTTFVPDFFKHLTSEDTSSRFLKIPLKFCNMHGDILQGNWILNIRNGYRMHVVYDCQNHHLLGMRKLFSDFKMIGGEVLIFEFVDGSNFNVYIFGEDGNEMDYPSNGHVSGDYSPQTVSTCNGGWKFVKIISNAEHTFDEVLLPRTFWRMFGSKIPEWFNYVLRNHFRFGGHLEYLERKLSGLRKICEGLRLSNFQKLELLVFTYDCGGFFKLSLFDGSSIEVRLDVNEITFGTLFLTLRYPCEFEVQVMPSYMLKNSPGVTISVDFFRTTNQWKKNDKISIHKGHLSWEFEIRKRRVDNRTSIYNGWKQFRKDMDLDVGDCCYFRWINESYYHFRVEVVRGRNLHI